MPLLELSSPMTYHLNQTKSLIFAHNLLTFSPLSDLISYNIPPTIILFEAVFLCIQEAIHNSIPKVVDLSAWNNYFLHSSSCCSETIVSKKYFHITV